MSTTARPSAAEQPVTPAASGRRWEIDALRGLMLVLMTVTHIPTRFSEPLGQPFGFVSAAEGFVLLSAYVAGRVYKQRQLRDGTAAMGSAFFRRALKIYLCQAGLLVFLLTLVALLGVWTEQPAITHLVSFFLENPTTAFFSGLLLLYNPPLLDILPMYILFMLASPLLLLAGGRRGWSVMLTASGIVWLAAQFGLSQTAYDMLVRFTGLPVPFRETGAFEILAWQFLWVLGLWIGAGEATAQPAQPGPFPRWGVFAALAIALVHFVWRHAIGQAPFPHDLVANMAYDKWQLGPMRLVNVMALLLLTMHFGPGLTRWLRRWKVLEQLGQQSLPVFCAHLVLAMLVLATFGSGGGDGDPKRSWALDALILATSFGVLYAVALVSERIGRGTADARARLRARRARRPRPRASMWRSFQPRLRQQKPGRDDGRFPPATTRSPRG